MSAATLLAEIEQAGAEIWADGDRLKFQGVPARLIPHIRENKPALLALLSGSMNSTPAPAPMQPAPAMAPERVSCGSCARFQPGAQPLSIGRCLATVDGQPPAGNGGDYRAAFPMAPRQCPEYAGVGS